VTVNLAMDLVRRGGHVVIAGTKNAPLTNFDSDWIPTRRITLHPGAGLDTEAAVRLNNEGRVPTADLLGDTFPLARFADAFALLTRRTPGHDSVRIALDLT
jgi:threonine dehydrogenase-like Zn-dependent dehydrogenase